MRLFSKMMVLFFAVALFSAASPDRTEDLAWEKYITSQKKMQVAIHHLIRLNHKDLSKVIDQSQELQLALADEKSVRFYDLLETYPDRILRDSGFDGFVNFPWTEEQTESLKRRSKDYRKLTKRIEKLKKVYADPDFKRVENHLMQLQTEREYREILARFRFISKEVEELLQFHPEG